MKGKRRTPFWKASLTAALALAAGVALSAGTASAKYISDGAVQNGTTGGWDLPADRGVCVTGIKSDGTMIIDPSITSRPDCIAKTFPAYTTEAACKTSDSAGANAEGSHYWASTCVDGSGNGISLKDLDRNANMCTQKGGTWGSKCTSAWTAMGPTWSAAPAPKPATGGTDGFCYTRVRMNDFYSVATCPAGSCSITNPNNGDLITSQSTCEGGVEDNAAAGGDNDGVCETGETCSTGVWTQGTFGYSITDTGSCAGAGATTKTSRSACEATELTGIDGDNDGVCETGETCGVWTPGFKCTYAYGISGVAEAKLTNMAGVTYANAGATVDLTGLTQGQCQYNGASFSNHTTKGGDATVGASVIATPITGVRAGCLSCHNNTSQYNGYAGRWKSNYLQTGHRNMLRKVTAGKKWAGPNESGVLEIYTEAAAGQTLDFIGATATGTYGTMTLMYIFGDWMAPAPDGLDTVIWDSAATPPKAKYNGGSDYSCAACHTTGWRNEDTAKGLCSLSSQATSGACTTAGGVWYPSSGQEGYGKGGLEPGASFASYKKGGVNPDANSIPGMTGQWDIDGIVCSRCHAVAYDPSLPLNENGVNAPPGFTTHETDIFEGEKITNICYGCHQSVAKTLDGTGPNADLAHPEALPVKNTATAPAYVPGLSGHVIGGSFLNSVHAKATATILPNSLGKYDIASGTYASTFKGRVCRSSTTVGGGSVLETKADGGEIKTLADCNRANGKAVGDTTSYGYWQDEAGAGNCTTCHNVHNSLFVAAQEEEALRRTCEDCHVHNSSTGATVASAPQVEVARMKHPTGPGTPFAHGEGESCVVCHMPKPTSADFPMHVWRINPADAYSTFPTAAEFGIGATATKKNANTSPDGTYTNAVWVDIDLACGQCHGGSAGRDATKNGAAWVPKAELAKFADGIHDGPPVTTSVTFGYALGQVMVPGTSTPDTLTVTVWAQADCGGACASYDWDFGDGSTGSGASTTHQYASAGTYPITLTVPVGSKTKNVTVYAADLPPAVDGTACGAILGSGADAWKAQLADTSTDVNGINQVTVNWGDGSMLAVGTHDMSYNHTYRGPGTYTITHKAIDSIGQQAIRTCAVTVKYFAIKGTVFQTDGTTPLQSAKIEVKDSGTGVVVRTVYTAANGRFTAGSLKPGAYNLTVTNNSYTFADPAASKTVGPSSANFTDISITATGTP